MLVKKLKKKLDAVFSKFIRLRDSIDGEHGFCITCGKLVDIKYADCGHYIKRQHLSTRYDEQNCNLQCKYCNAFQQGANELYKVALDKKYGPGTSDKLEQKKRNKTNYQPWWYELQIKEYQQKLKEVK